MSEIVIIGGGMGGLTAALLLAKDGHRVTVLERDPSPPPADGDAAWDSWERRGVNQFRMIHFFLARFRGVIEAELPEVVKELESDGVLRLNAIAEAPAELTGGYRDGDERFEAMTGRRPMVEAAFGRTADAAPGVTVRRGVAVKGLLTGDPTTDGIPHVIGVVTDGGEEIRADLVVDATGRRSSLPRMLSRGRCRRSGRGDGGLRLRLLRPVLPVTRRRHAAGARAAAAVLRLGVVPHPARRQRHVGDGHGLQRRRCRPPTGPTPSTCGSASWPATR